MNLETRNGQGWASLDLNARAAMERAIQVRERSYSPYSNFKVGAAIRGADQKIYEGCNIETVGYNNSLHAEMSALAKMVSAGCREPELVVVVTEAPEPIFPCGFCRQYLSEFGQNIWVIAAQLSSQKWRMVRLDQLLPETFIKEHVGK